MWLDHPILDDAIFLSDFARKQIQQDRERARDFCSQVIRPLAIEIDRSVEAGTYHAQSELGLEVGRSFAKWNWLSHWMPRYWGGQGANPLSSVVVFEEMARECVGFSNVLGAHWLSYSILSNTSHAPLTAKICRDVVSGERNGEARFIASIVSESSTNRTYLATSDGVGGYEITGAKRFVGNAPWASWFVIVAPTDSASVLDGVVAVVPANRAGLSIGALERKLGQHAFPLSTVACESLPIEPSEIALDLSQFSMTSSAPDSSSADASSSFQAIFASLHDTVLALSRSNVAAMSAGVGRRVLDETIHALKLEKALSRSRSSKPGVLEQDWIQDELAKMTIEVMRARTAAWSSRRRQEPIAVARSLTESLFENALSSAPEWFLNLIGVVLSKRSRTEKIRTKQLLVDDSASARIRFGWAAYVKASTSAMPETIARRAIELIGPDSIMDTPGLFKILRDAKVLSVQSGTNVTNQADVFSSWMSGSVTGLTPASKSFEEASWV